jgi:DNA-binding response OmpR family regulator/anti-sigma regulatory factor (Ser/Thr protein kinase)
MKSDRILILVISASSLMYLGSAVFPGYEWSRSAALVHTAVFLSLSLMALKRQVAGRFPGKAVLAGMILCSTGGTAGILLGPPLIMGPLSWGIGLTGTTLFLPRRDKETDTSAPAEAAPVDGACATTPAARIGPGGPEKDLVMVVDDDPACLNTVTAILSRHNIPSTAVEDSQEALAGIKNGLIPGVLLLDIMMPGISGIELCRRLRRVYPPSELPIIMITGGHGKDDLVKAYEAGASDYITKPFSAVELVARVRCHRDLHQAYHTVKENLRLEMELRLQREKSRTASRAAEREGLEKLQYQLRPHFLFNALAAIRGAIFSDRQAAHDMVTHLSEFCRLTLVKGGDEILTIEEEIVIVRHYLAMEKLRYGDYMAVTVDIGLQAGTVSVPAFIIQPLVENAIKYGSRSSPDFLDITIMAACRDEGRVMIRVSNTGDWVPPRSGTSEKSTGTGIKNIKARLAHAYGEDFQWEQEAGNGSVTISLSLPRDL